MVDFEKIMQRRDRKILLSSLQDTRVKLFSALGLSLAGTSDATLKCCMTLSDIPDDKRRKYVRDNWSIDHMAKVEPVLAQLKSIEDRLAGSK